jgi:glutamate:GABA antiporter
MTGLRKTLGFRDLLLFYIATTFSLRWMATAAASGPSALVVWLVGAAGLFVPLVFATLELSARYPQEGGVYIWSREAFGPFAGFITAWLYWCTNLPYFPSLLYFAAGNLLFVGGASWQTLSSSSGYFVAASVAGLAFTLALNIVGLDSGKWLSNAAGVASWTAAVVLIALGGLAWSRFGSATSMAPASFVPGLSLKDAIFWSTIAFAFGGVESASSLADEIHDAARTVPRAILTAAVAITVLYLAGTFSILLAVPQAEVSGLQGIMQAIAAVATRVGAAWLVPVLAALVVLSATGGVFGWFAAVARLPFVAGLDRYLPAAFGRLHPRWQTPHVALLTQAAIALVFVVLGQAGTSVRGAYDVLVSMSIITYFVPFLFMFAALIRVQSIPVAPGTMRVPGGRPVAIALASIGLVTTGLSIVLACVPPDDEPNATLAVAKVVGLSLVMIASGAAMYGWRARVRDVQ